jgi:hypothetical protein
MFIELLKSQVQRLSRVLLLKRWEETFVDL